MQIWTKSAYETRKTAKQEIVTNTGKLETKTAISTQKTQFHTATTSNSKY